MSEYTQKTNGVWAEEKRRQRSSSSSSNSSSDSSKVQLPSVRALASRFNSLSQQEGTVLRGASKPSATTRMPVKQAPKPAPAPVKAKTPPTKEVETKVEKSSVSSVNAASQTLRQEVQSDKPRVSVTTDTDDDVFEAKTAPPKTEAPAHFSKKPQTGDSKPKTGYSASASRSTAKKWSSLSDLHTDSSPKQRSDSVSSTTIFGVSLRRVDSISWGVTQTRKASAADESDSSSDDELRVSTPEFGKSDGASKLETFQKNRPVESVPDKKRTGGGGVKSKVNQKMGNKEEVKYHSYSDLSTAGADTGATWPRRIAVGGVHNAPHQPLTRRQSISDLLKLYRSKSQTDLSQAATDSKPPPSPKFETFARPKTPVSAPLTMYDLKINNPMEKAKVTPYKAPTKDIVRLPPGSVSITFQRSALILAPVPHKNGSLKNNTATDIGSARGTPSASKETPIQLEKSNATKTSPVEKSPSPTAKENLTPKPSLASSTASIPAAKATAEKTFSSSSSNSDSVPQPTPTPKPVVHPRFVYQPPPKHFNRPIISQTSSAICPVETIVIKPEVKPKTTSIQNLSRLYTPTSYGGRPGHVSRNSVETPDQSHSSSSSDDEKRSKPLSQKKPEKETTEKVTSPVTNLIKSLNAMKAKPTFAVKPDVLKPKPQDPVRVQKVDTASTLEKTSSLNSRILLNSHADHNKLEKKDSSASSDSADGIPHDEKGSSFFVARPAGAPLLNKGHHKNIPSTPPNTPSGKLVKSKKLDKLTVEDSLNSWAKEVNKKDTTSSEESSDDEWSPEETTGSYDFTTTGLSKAPKVPTSASNDITKGNSASNVILLKHEPIVDKSSSISQSEKRLTSVSNEKNNTISSEIHGDSLPATVSVRKSVKILERSLSSSSDDGNQKRQSKLPTPVANHRRPQPVHQQNNIDHHSKSNVTGEKKNSSQADSVNRKSVSSEHSSSGETSASEPFKEIDPYAIGRMIVRGSRKSDSVVKKPEHLTSIKNASVPSHSPFSPLKSPTRKLDTVNTAKPKPKAQRNNSSSDEGKLSPKPQVQTTISSKKEQGNYKVTKTKRGNFIHQSLSASDFESSDGERGGLELAAGHDSDYGDGVYSANVAFIE